MSFENDLDLQNNNTQRHLGSECYIEIVGSVLSSLVMISSILEVLALNLVLGWSSQHSIYRPWKMQQPPCAPSLLEVPQCLESLGGWDPDSNGGSTFPALTPVALFGPVLSCFSTRIVFQFDNSELVYRPSPLHTQVIRFCKMSRSLCLRTSASTCSGGMLRNITVLSPFGLSP